MPVSQFSAASGNLPPPIIHEGNVKKGWTRGSLRDGSKIEIRVCVSIIGLVWGLALGLGVG
jgi:hypothetical protein